MPNDPDDTMSVFWPKAGKEDRMPDTPDLSEEYCPVCEPVQELKAIVRPVLCTRHQDQLTPKGAEDDRVDPIYIGGSFESTGETNRRMSALLRGENETETPNLQTPEEA